MALESGITYLRSSTCQAAANYWNPAVKLYGPYGSGQFLAVYVSASNVVTLRTTQGGQIFGILQNSPDINQAAEVAYGGECKAVAGGTFTAGAYLMVDANARLILWAAGAGNVQVAMAMEAAPNADSVVRVLVNPPGRVVLT